MVKALVTATAAKAEQASNAADAGNGNTAASATDEIFKTGNFPNDIPAEDPSDPPMAGGLGVRLGSRAAHVTDMPDTSLARLLRGGPKQRIDLSVTELVCLRFFLMSGTHLKGAEFRVPGSQLEHREDGCFRSMLVPVVIPALVLLVGPL